MMKFKCSLCWSELCKMTVPGKEFLPKMCPWAPKNEPTECEWKAVRSKSYRRALVHRLATAEKKLAALSEERLSTGGSDRIRIRLFERYTRQRELVDSLRTEIAELEESAKD